MKIHYLLLSFLFLQSCKGLISNAHTTQHNYIDSIQTAKQIEDLLPKIDANYTGFLVNQEMKFKDWRYQERSNTLGVKPWQKMDFDKNGLMDMVVIGRLEKFGGHTVLCILDKGKDRYEIKHLPATDEFFACSFPVLEAKNGQNLIHYYTQKGGRGRKHKPEKVQLVYRYGDFIEYTNAKTQHKIEKIEYEALFGCFGSCPVFDIAIQHDKSVIWYALNRYDIKNTAFQGKYKTTVSDAQYKEMSDLLNYIDLEKLKDKYAVRWTDDQTATLIITYDNGKVKSIQDYGMRGTFGLSRLYELMRSLRENSQWTKIE
jgi:hypothetical protein